MIGYQDQEILSRKMLKLKYEYEELFQKYVDVCEALRDLVDTQNGPPLLREKREWEDAMKRAKILLDDEDI